MGGGLHTLPRRVWGAPGEGGRVRLQKGVAVAQASSGSPDAHPLSAQRSESCLSLA